MSTIVTRAGKGSPLTHAEVDSNFTNLNADKVEKTSADITGGSINGTTIGSSSASTGAFTTATASTSFGSPVFKATSSAGGALQNSGGTPCLQWGGGGGSNLTLDVNTNVTGAIALNGGTTIGDASGDSFTINSSAVSVPNGLNFNSNALVLNTSGNLGLGVTPSAWKSTSKALQVSGVSIESDQSLNTLIGTNAYRASDGSYKYIANGNAMLYQQYQAAHTWYSSASGTAGNAITFTQAMTLDASGNLGIGTSSPVSPLTVFQASANDAATNAISIMRFGTTYGSSIFHNYQTSVGGEALNLSVSDGSGTPANNTLTKYRMGANGTHYWFGASTSTERMRIDSSGNLLFNSGYGSVATAYGCRVWVNFVGTGTVSIRASGNVSSISDAGGTGNYFVNFTNAMPDASYAVVCNGSNADGENDSAFANGANQGAGSCQILTTGDSAHVSVAIFR
jgi:hypothetical protein